MIICVYFLREFPFGAKKLCKNLSVRLEQSSKHAPNKSKIMLLLCGGQPKFYSRNHLLICSNHRPFMLKSDTINKFKSKIVCKLTIVHLIGGRFWTTKTFADNQKRNLIVRWTSPFNADADNIHHPVITRTKI